MTTVITLVTVLTWGILGTNALSFAFRRSRDRRFGDSILRNPQRNSTSRVRLGTLRDNCARSGESPGIAGSAHPAWQTGPMSGAVAIDETTVAAFRRGDDTAVRRFYDTYGRMMFAVASRILGDRGHAEEATQQAFVQAWRAASSLDSTRDPAPWLATIVRRVAIDIQRREARRPASASAAASPNCGSLRPLFFRPHAIRQRCSHRVKPHATVRTLRVG